jgi:hypothetical protein
MKIRVFMSDSGLGLESQLNHFIEHWDNKFEVFKVEFSTHYINGSIRNNTYYNALVLYQIKDI